MKFLKSYPLYFERKDSNYSTLIDEIYLQIVKQCFEKLDELNFKISGDVIVFNIETKHGNLDLVITSFIKNICGFGLSQVYKTPFIAIPNDFEKSMDISLLTYICSYEQGIKHEIVHYIDYIKNPNRKLRTTLLTNGLDNYINDTSEINAYFLQAVNKTIKRLKESKDKFESKTSTFEIFRKYIFHNMDIDDGILNLLNDKSKKRLNKRIYELWTNLSYS